MKTKLRQDWLYNPNRHDVAYLVHQADRVVRWNYIARGPQLFTMEDIERQHNLTKEEWAGKGEFLESYNAGDKVGTLDGLCDMFVTGSQEAHMSLDPGMTLKDQIEGLKFTPYLDLSAREVPDLQTICNLLFSFNGEWKGALEHVLDSNDSKFESYDPTKVSQYDAHCVYIMDQGRYKSVHWVMREGKVIYFDENKKILKGRNFFEPNLIPFA